MPETTVKMSCAVLNVKNQEYEITHAQDLINLEKKMGVDNWKLTDPQFTLENGIIKSIRRVTLNSKKQKIFGSFVISVME